MITREIQGERYTKEKLAAKFGCSVTTLNTYLGRAEFCHIKCSHGNCNHVTQGDIRRLEDLIHNRRKRKVKDESKRID